MAEQRSLAELRDDPTVKDYLSKLDAAEKAIVKQVEDHKPGPEEEERAEILENAVDYLEQAREDWNQEDPEGLAPTDKFWILIEDILTMFSDGMIPSSCRKLAELVMEMVKPWQDFAEKLDLTGAEAGVPGADFWRAFESVNSHRAAVTIGKANSLEPIDTLITQGVSERQICEMYGFCTRVEKANGTITVTPHLEILREEMATPGKHTGQGTGWMSPMEAKHQDELAQARLAGKRVITELQANRNRRNSPETVLELAKQDVSLRQMSQMKGISVEEIRKQLEDSGLRVPPLDYEPVEVARSPLESDLTEDEKRLLESQVGPDAQIKMARRRRSATAKSAIVREFVLEQHEKGLDPVKITRAIKKEFSNLKVHGNVVRSIIQKALKQEKEAEQAIEKKRILTPKPLPPDMPPMTFESPNAEGLHGIEAPASMPIPEGVPGVRQGE